jgi:Putative auto-transporter adhesin, head GIN domain
MGVRRIVLEGMNFMKRRTILFAAVLGVMLAGCHWLGIRGNGQITTDQRTIAIFSEIEADGAFQIEWRSGAPALSITTDENLLRYIDSEKIDDRLRLYSARNLWPTHGIKVVASSPTRSAARLTGVTRLTAKQLTGEKFAVESSGAATVMLDGAVDKLLADMTGASELKARSLQTKTAELSTTGAADADVAVTDILRVSITGAGKVTYSGNPPTIEKHVTGAGSVRHKE